MNPAGTKPAPLLDTTAGAPAFDVPPWAGDGPVLFARYAYPPNALGYCGPADHAALLGHAATGQVDPELGQLARGFSGAWPYLELIAGEAGIADPLDRRVVEAYWLGSSLLGRVDMTRFGGALLDRFRKRAGTGWGYLAEAIPAGALPTHSFHVFGIYPWVGLLRGERVEHPLHVLDRCRIRWGKVLSVDGDMAEVTSQPLTWDGTSLRLGEYRTESATRGFGGSSLADGLAPGEWVALHWDWVCDRLSRRQLANLRRFSLHQLEITNRRVSRSGAATLLA